MKRALMVHQFKGGRGGLRVMVMNVLFGHNCARRRIPGKPDCFGASRPQRCSVGRRHRVAAELHSLTEEDGEKCPGNSDGARGCACVSGGEGASGVHVLFLLSHKKKVLKFADSLALRA